MPKFLSQEAMDLIRRLLDRHPMQRLGSRGASEVKKHPFFNGIDWDDVKNRKTFPPVRKKKLPKLKDISVGDFLDPESIGALQREKLKLPDWSFVNDEERDSSKFDLEI
mmetsp:Transcript_38531/g.28380  ORF Transcript_38531/g.28380 Transcript_38531/m.28380 type:complete len:109 (+) Transcript_38531:1885-2211(+)